MLFSDQRQHALKLPLQGSDGKAVNIAFLIDYLCENVMQDSRKELFVLDNHLYVFINPPSTPPAQSCRSTRTPLQAYSRHIKDAASEMSCNARIRSL